MNMEGGMPAPDEELFVQSNDLKGTQIGEDGDGLLFDIKNQLVELNVTMATIGEMFGDYIGFIARQDE